MSESGWTNEATRQAYSLLMNDRGWYESLQAGEHLKAEDRAEVRRNMSWKVVRDGGPINWKEIEATIRQGFAEVSS